MTKEQIDILWHAANKESIEKGEMYTRYRFAELVAQHVLEKHREEHNKIELWRGLALCREGDGRAIAQIEKEAAAKERSACAALAEQQRDSEEYGHAKAACSHIVEAIRARGE